MRLPSVCSITANASCGFDFLPQQPLLCAAWNTVQHKAVGFMVQDLVLYKAAESPTAQPVVLCAGRPALLSRRMLYEEERTLRRIYG